MDSAVAVPRELGAAARNTGESSDPWVNKTASDPRLSLQPNNKMPPLMIKNFQLQTLRPLTEVAQAHFKAIIHIQIRSLSFSSLTFLFTTLPTPLIPPTIFLTLLITLWTWKCLWIIILQDKLLYLSWLPPLSRSEEVGEYKGEFRGVDWREGEIRSLDGVRLRVVEGRRKRKKVVIAYLQGNGGSTPLRLPLLSQTLRAIHEHAKSTSTSPPHRTANGSTGSKTETEYILLALSYRGYWKSKGRATQTGLRKDAQAFLNWIAETYTEPNTELSVVLWGHSLGAAVASDALVRRLSTAHYTGAARIKGLELEVDGTETKREKMRPIIKGLILEAPISSIKDMLISLYPQKWLPYRYLWPFSWNNWDVKASLERLSQHKALSSTPAHLQAQDAVPPILLLSAESDEVIPPWVADQLEEKAKSVGLNTERKDVKGAMHIECPLKHEGRKALVEFITGSSSSSSSSISAPAAGADTKIQGRG
ncbi:alpha/beta hydrolase [Aspergillus stella-maris]|uniref:alpha/beta hydrolase n=1 Tax=Aspergillus stella-maris TaxID=1810926 RepID=UPI003CCE3E71